MIKEVEEHKHLGLMLQKNGKWTKQVNEMKIRAAKRTDILRGYMHYLGRRSLERLYLTYIRPILEYGNIVWDNISEKESNELEGIQLSAARIITGGKKGTSHLQLYNDFQWQTLKTRRANHKNFMMYKIKNNLAPETLTNLLPQAATKRHSHNIRSKENLTILKTKTAQTQKSFFPRTVKTWNDMSLGKKI